MQCLELEAISLSFGGIQALDQVSFAIEADAVTGLIGPNGAGKTSLFNCLSGLYRPDSGSIRLGEQNLIGAKPHQIATAGIGRTFQNLATFETMTVLQSVMVGAHLRSHTSLWAHAFNLSRARRVEEALRATAERAIAFVGLSDIAEAPLTTLPFGTRKRVELARALAVEPRLLLLDEPAGGLNREELEDLSNLIRRVPGEFGAAVLLVEHNMQLVMALCSRIIVLNFGRVIADGSPDTVRNHPDVVAAYLGGQAA
jgi:branched-chain amino acid transport system ATP-binding protein